MDRYSRLPAQVRVAKEDMHLNFSSVNALTQLAELSWATSLRRSNLPSAILI